MPSKILILGAKGMLGGALKQELAGREVFTWDREEVDIADFVSLREKIVSLRPEVIINAAAYNAVDNMETGAAEFELAEKINGETVGELAKIAKKLGAILAHYSSDYVFKGDKKEGYREGDSPAPLNRYGETKLLGERLLQENGEKYYLIRLSRLFGKSGAGEGVKKSFVEAMLDLYVQGRREFDLVDEELSSPTYAPDLARLTWQLIESGRPWGVYHGANSGACTWYSFGQEIFKIKGYDVKLKAVSGGQYPRPAKRPAYTVLLNTKLPAQRLWQTALREYLK
ncbi:MAG: dTDP-4-dehydrorhamnose reductase [Candidatus Magasanikbacteria bacterium]|nr:dTDP-4-dehydrorhamnose reductase [Candidatus Magasanikbacteria bacterium]